MRKIGAWSLGGIIIAAIAIGLFTSKAGQKFTPPMTEMGERQDGGYFSLVDDDDRVVVQTALLLGIGDQYISEDNDLYEITKMIGDEAKVVSKGKIDMPDVTDALKALERADSADTARNAVTADAGESPSTFATGFFRRITAAAGRGQDLEVGIYHTHNAESYEPTSGTAFKDEGDIFDVGEALADAFQQMGIAAQWSNASHLPHDGQAYNRSRRTAIQMARKQPVTLLDVHRDAIPDPDTYRATVNGEQMSRVRLVVGKQNQNREANLEYAKRIKAIADERYPHLIQGIFHAQGNYNQDIGPRMLLLEFGTHKTTADEAIKSTEPMAEVIAAAAGMTAGTSGGNLGAASGRTALWLVVLLVAGGTLWLYINKEGWDGVKQSVARIGQSIPGRRPPGGDDGGDGDES